MMYARFSFFTITALLMAGCSSTSKPPGTKLERFSLIAHKNLNHDSAMRVDLVALYNKNLLAKLKEIPSAEYYKKIPQLRRDNAGSIVIMRWELVPAQILEGYVPVIPKPDNVEGVLFFADYNEKGSHRALIDTDARSTRIILGEKDIISVENNKKAPHTGKDLLKVYPVDATLIMDNTTATSGKMGKKDA